MADDIDLHDLLSGDADMVGRDFKNADLGGANLQGRDFSRSKFGQASLEDADFSGSNLTGAFFHSASLKRAKFQDIHAKGANFSRTNAEGASFVGATLIAAVFSRASLKDADLTGANCARANFTDADLRGAITSEATNFEGAIASRSVARQPAFRYYKVERGNLVKKTEDELAAEPHRVNTASIISGDEVGDQGEISIRDAALGQIGTLLRSLDPPDLATAPEHLHGGIGHNQPPEPIPLNEDERQTLLRSLLDLQVELHRDEVRPEIVKEATAQISNVGAKIAGWVAQKANLAAEEMAKEVGKTLGDARLWLAWWLTLSGQLESVVAAVLRVLH